MKRIPASILAAISILLVLSALAFGGAETKPALDPLIDSLSAVREFRQAAVSPDGTRVAWVERLTDATGNPSANSAIYVADLSSAAAPPRRISACEAGCAEHDVAWSPDGKRLAFLSDAESGGQFQLYGADLEGSPPRKLTSLAGYLAEPRWSPDGKTIAILFTENAPRAAGPLEAMTPDSGVVGAKIYEQRLTAVDLASGRVRPLSPPDLYVYEYDWSPDGKNLVFTAGPGLGDDNWYIARLYTLSVSSGKMEPILKPPLQIGVPRWSPDGKTIAYVGGLMSDEGSIGGDIFVLPVAGGAPRDLTPGVKASANWLAWSASSNQILFVEDLDGSTAVAAIDLATEKVATLWTGPEVIGAGEDVYGHALSLARDGKTSAVIRDSFERPPEIWAGPIGDWKQVTRINQNIRPSWGAAKRLHWTSDGMRIQGWLLYPHDYDSKRRYPLVVSVHGGPGSANRPGWPRSFYNTSLLSSLGYFVLYPNPRGSFGQGEQFTQANVKDFGYGDLRDILAGVDEVAKTEPVAPHRIGITGWSYGGFMTMWAVTQTHRFRAAVAGAGIANWQSYYGENDLDQWMIPFFGASVYDDPAVYAKSSPIDFIKNVQTPTLVLVGDRDGEVPAPQSYEFWHALKTLGVETEFVIYPNEGHNIQKPEDRRDITRRMIEWFDQHLQ